MVRKSSSCCRLWLKLDWQNLLSHVAKITIIVEINPSIQKTCPEALTVILAVVPVIKTDGSVTPSSSSPSASISSPLPVGVGCPSTSPSMVAPKWKAIEVLWRAPLLPSKVLYVSGASPKSNSSLVINACLGEPATVTPAGAP